MTKPLKPLLRFNSFNEDWEQRKLGDIITEYKETVDSDCTLPILTSSKTEGVILQEEHFGRKQQHDITGYNILPRNYCTYRNRSDGVDFTFNINKCCDKGIISKFYPVFSGKNSDVFFLSLVLNNSEEVVREIAYTCIGTGQKVLSFLDLQKMKVRVPNFDEQKEIATYFDNLDHLITLHQRKLDTLKVVKKSMLEKMFPREGCKVPEVRFSGFTEDWEQRKLSEIYQNIGNAFVGTSTPYYVEHGHFYLESNNIKDGQINHNSEIFINDEFYERQKDKWLHTGDMVMVQSGHVGHTAVIPEELDNSAAHALIMFRNPKVEIDPYFLNYQYQTNKSKKKIENITTGNTIKHILASDMQEFTVDTPKIEEQQHIARYFLELDHLITLHQRELELLQNLKKSLLEKMFV